MALHVKLVSAQLSHDTEMFSNMDPYCYIQLGSQRYRSKTKQEAGKKPVWNQCFQFTSTDNILKITVMDQDVVSDDLVGEGTLNVTKFRSINTQMQEVVQLYYQGKTAGKIMLMFSTSPFGQTAWGNNSTNTWGANNQNSYKSVNPGGYNQPVNPPYSPPVNPQYNQGYNSVKPNYNQPVNPYSQPINNPGYNPGLMNAMFQQGYNSQPYNSQPYNQPNNQPYNNAPNNQWGQSNPNNSPWGDLSQNNGWGNFVSTSPNYNPNPNPNMQPNNNNINPLDVMGKFLSNPNAYQNQNNGGGGYQGNPYQ